jgi:hypothetical protein
MIDTTKEQTVVPKNNCMFFRCVDHYIR